jgi:hypothetical protein
MLKFLIIDGNLTPILEQNMSTVGGDPGAHSFIHDISILALSLGSMDVDGIVAIKNLKRNNTKRTWV